MNFKETKEKISAFLSFNHFGLKKYLVKDGKKHPFVLIIPGGGYSSVCSYIEGEPFAKNHL